LNDNLVSTTTKRDDSYQTNMFRSNPIIIRTLSYKQITYKRKLLRRGCLKSRKLPTKVYINFYIVKSNCNR